MKCEDSDGKQKDNNKRQIQNVQEGLIVLCRSAECM